MNKQRRKKLNEEIAKIKALDYEKLKAAIKLLEQTHGTLRKIEEKVAEIHGQEYEDFENRSESAQESEAGERSEQAIQDMDMLLNHLSTVLHLFEPLVDNPTGADLHHALTFLQELPKVSE